MSYRTYIAATRAAYIAGIEAGISPQELRAHTGVMGEAFVADYLGVKLSSANNQRGYDLVDADGLRVSVKTITTATHVTLKESTLPLVDRIVVVWVDTDADELDLTVVYDKGVEEMQTEAAIYNGSLRLSRGRMTFPHKPAQAAGKFDVGEVVDTYVDGNVEIRKHASGSFTALVDGEPQPARQYMIAIRDGMGLPDKTTNTTRSLGAQIFGALGR